MIEPATKDDAAEICEIYNHYVLETPITFEEQPVVLDEMVKRIEGTLPSLPWLVFRDAGAIRGFCYSSPWKGRSAYRHSVELTIYLRAECVGRRFGSQLYETILRQLRERQIHTVIGGIALPNQASVALHEKFGFTKVAHFKEVGYKLGRWIDVEYWQLFISAN